jgi:CDP-glucose 4,6-dehydratase
MGALVNPVSKDSFLAAYAGKRVLVTGHTGFKGSWLAQQLLMMGAEVMGYALPPDFAGSHFERLGLARRLRHVEGDVRNFDRLACEVQAFQPEVVFHLAAQALVRKSYLDPKSTFDVNISGGVNLLETVRQCASVRALVFITSDKCYENREWVWGYRETDQMGGHDPYSASKGAAELVFSSYLRSFFASRANFGAASARAGNVIGGGDWSPDRIVPDCVRAIESKTPIVIRSPRATRPWQHVLEPLSGYLTLGATLLAQGHCNDGSWNFGPPVGEMRTVLDVARSLAAQFDGAQVTVDEPKEPPHEAHLLQLNSDKARQLLHWQTRWDFEQTLQETAHWSRAVLVDKVPATDVTSTQISRFYGGQL